MPAEAPSAAPRAGAPAGDVEVTHDRLLGGRIVVRQPAHGYRSAIDPVLLAAAVPASQGGRILELGCGVGVASLCLAHRVAACDIVAVERDPRLAALARANVAANGFGERVSVHVGDFADFAGRFTERFDHAFANPPYFRPGTVRMDDVEKRRSYAEDGAALADWLAALLRAVRHGGRVTVIHRAERLPELLAGLGRRAGDVAIYPLWPKQGVAAKRVIVSARRNSNGPARLLAGMTLHRRDGTYTDAAHAILRDGAAIDCG